MEYGDMATWPSAGKGLPLQGNVFAVTWEGSGKGFGVWWTVQAEVLAGQSRTPAVIPGAAPPGPRLGRGRRIFLYVVCWVPCTEKNRGRRNDCCSTIRCSFVSIVLFVDSVTLGYAAMEKSKQQQCFDFVTGALLEVNHCPVDALVGSGTYYWIPFSHENRVCIDEKNPKTDHATTRRQTHR
jgi:hypothetical protein